MKWFLMGFVATAIGLAGGWLLYRDPPRYGSDVQITKPAVEVKEWTGPIEGETP